MLATFRETIRSIQDRSFGREIINKSLSQVTWYWTKYLIVIASITALLGLCLLTYFVPQLPRLAQQNLPDINIQIKDGKLITDLTEPFIQENNNFTLIISPMGTEKDLDGHQSGILVLSDTLITKTPEQSRSLKLSEIGDLAYTKSDAVSWTRDNQFLLLIVGIFTLIIFSLLFWGFYWVSRWPGFIAVAIVSWLAARFWKRSMTYYDALKISIFAAVFPLMIFLASLFTTTPIITILSLVVWLFYCLTWTYRLPSRIK
jgi:hypothetical protein